MNKPTKKQYLWQFITSAWPFRKKEYAWWDMRKFKPYHPLKTPAAIVSVVLRNRIVQLLLVAFTLWYALMWTAGWMYNFIPLAEVKNPQYGVSFSIKQARNLGLDPHENLNALLTDMGIKRYRLMSYWDEIEKTRGTFDFSDLDWQVNEIASRGGHITMSIGLRQPRWPECHAPDWSYELKGGAWKQALYAYMEVVVKRYESSSAIISWQLENEAYNAWFGLCDAADTTRIEEEFSLVKSWSQKPIWMSLSDQHGIPLQGPWPDKYGFSVYRWIYNLNTPPTNTYMVYPTPLWYHRARANLIRAYTGKDIFIHELQLEPWGPVDTKYLSVDEQNRSMSVNQIHENLSYTRKIGAEDIYVWGGEWWYWRKLNGDSSIWDAVKSEIHAQNNQ